MIGRFVLAVLCVSAPFGALAEPRPAKPLFATDAPLHLTMRGPIEGVANSKVPLDAIITVDGRTSETLPVQLAARGITRRAHDICQFPPLRIRFGAKPPAGSVFSGQKSLKLVTHCRAASGFQQYLLLEYAAYRMYALLTPASFATRLATIDYVDAKGRPIVTRLGFLIEDVDDVAGRNGTKAYKTTARLPSAVLVARDAARYAMFQTMIGNLDWAMTAGPAGTDCCHNSKLLGDAAMRGSLVPVPYDFDFSGMVDAPYATPPQGIIVASVRVRRYRGYCRNNTEATAAAADLLGRRAEIVGVLDTIPQLDAGRRRKAQAYLAAFFDQIATPRGVDTMLSTCVR